MRGSRTWPAGMACSRSGSCRRSESASGRFTRGSATGCSTARYRGVYSIGPHLTPRGWWKAATLAAGPSAALSHRAAGALRDLVAWKGGPIDVTVPGAKRKPRRGLRYHAAADLGPADVEVVDAIPVTALPRTLLDLATVLTERELRRAHERAERLEVLDVNAIAELLDRCNGHRGVGALTALLEYDPTLAAEALSELERLFLDLLRERGIALPQVNVLLDGYLVDAFWPEANLVVELDGYEFHHDREAFERDRRKIAALRLAAREVVSFTYAQVTREPGWVVATVTALLERGRRAVVSAGS
jgi:very-short-patch-repair endonuclease